MVSQFSDGVTDAATLFTISGMVDKVRDVSLRMAKVNIDDPAAVALLTARYNLLRAAIPATVTAAVGAQLRSLTGELPDGETSLGMVVAEASLLAHFLDLLLAGPAFLVKRQVAQAEIEKISSSLEADAQGALASLVTVDDPFRLEVPGAYL